MAHAGTLAGMKGIRILRAVVTAAVLSGMSFAQGGAAAEKPGQRQALRITPLRPIAELRAEALKAKPPEEPGTFERPSLVDIAKLDAPIHFDIRYATARNVLGVPLYDQARAFLQVSAADALVEVSRKLMPKGLGILIYDA